jgi:hypothetical protein
MPSAFDYQRKAARRSAYRVLAYPARRHPVCTGLDGVELRLPVNAAHRPSLEALAEHRAITGL